MVPFHWPTVKVTTPGSGQITASRWEEEARPGLCPLSRTPSPQTWRSSWGAPLRLRLQDSDLLKTAMCSLLVPRGRLPCPGLGAALMRREAAPSWAEHAARRGWGW